MVDPLKAKVPRKPDGKLYCAGYRVETSVVSQGSCEASIYRFA
jgi:hypothetical protein